MINKNLEKLKEMFKKDPQIALGIYDIILLDDKIGKANIHYKVTKHMCHSGNIAQGGFITGWLDASMALACMANVGKDVLVLSIEIKTSFFNMVTIGDVFAEGWIVKKGKNIAFLEGNLKDKDNNILAKGSQTVKLKQGFYKY